MESRGTLLAEARKSVKLIELKLNCLIKPDIRLYCQTAELLHFTGKQADKLSANSGPFLLVVHYKQIE